MMKLETITIGQQGNANPLDLRLFHFEGNKCDQSAFLQANVHGAEIQGNAVIYQILVALRNNPDIICGKITLLPQANPLAAITKMGTWTLGRFNPVTGDNWNRLYKDILANQSLDQFTKKDFNKQQFKAHLEKAIDQKLLELKEYGENENALLNLHLQKLAARADYVLDLHTGPIACDYLYVAEYLKEKSKDLNFPHHLIIPNEFGMAMDEASFMPWIHLKKALENSGKNYDIPFESYTLELGSEEVINTELAKKQAAKIMQYLLKRELISDNPLKEHLNLETPKTCLLSDYKTYYAPKGGLVEYHAKPGQEVKKGEILFSVLSFEDPDRLLEKYHAKKDCLIINHTTSGNIRKGMELYQVMENYQ